MHDEQWKNIPGYEGMYQVSNLGRVRSKDRRVPTKAGNVHRLPGKLKSITIGGIDRRVVCLSKHARNTTAGVADLVLAAFVGPKPDELAIARHRDGDKANNHVENLFWGTMSDAVREAKGQTACKRGHLLEGTNLVASSLKRGKRMCRACHMTSHYISDRSDPEFQKLSDWKYLTITREKVTA